MNPGGSRLARFRALGPTDQRVLLICAAWLPLFSLGLRVLGLARFKARLERSPVTTQGPLSLADSRQLGDLVNKAARHGLFPATCLTRSLLLYWLLHRRGVRSDLRIGVRITQGVFAAHAWVECDGVPVNESLHVIRQFEPFEDLVPASAFDTP